VGGTSSRNKAGLWPVCVVIHKDLASKFGKWGLESGGAEQYLKACALLPECLIVLSF